MTKTELIIHKYYSILYTLLVVLLLIIGVAGYNYYINYYTTQSHYDIINEALMQQSQTFQSIIKSDKNLLKMAADTIDTKNMDYNINTLNISTLLTDTSFKEFYITDVNGNIYSSDGDSRNISTRGY